MAPELYGIPKPERTRSDIKENDAIKISVKFNGKDMEVKGQEVRVDVERELTGFEMSIGILMTDAFSYKSGLNGLFDRFQTGMIPDYIKSYLESSGLLPSEIFKLMNALGKFDAS